MTAASGLAVPDEFVLLVNALEVKGFDLLVAVATRLPGIPFVAIASQSDLNAAVEYARERGAGNVAVIPRTDDMKALYRRAKIVVVPSYHIIETFSRVCIEAHRFGKPVIGCDVGNVPYLLDRSGIVLPEDAGLWAAEIERLYRDHAYYAERQAMARRNSDAYPYADQREAILGITDAVQRQFLIGVGSGIGDMIHVSPTIRRVSQALGRKVDLVVAEDHSQSLFLLHDPRWVNAVYSLQPIVLSRRYETVFLTHSFGLSEPPFQADRVVSSRRWDKFTPDHRLHEAHFNLEAAKQLLGIDYGPADIVDSYVGTLAYRWRDGDLVGFHAGSKDGCWVSKRWPGFAELAVELQARNFRVASFGTPNEYVEGTEDRTGGSIEHMARNMMECSWFVSNDSGVMNIANALGIPLVAVFGPTESRTRGPLRPTSRSVVLHKPCAPCEWKTKDTFVSGLCRCIGEVEVSMVLAAFEDMVAAQRGPAEAEHDSSMGLPLPGPCGRHRASNVRPAPTPHILVPTSAGELVDKITILRIKRDRLIEPAKKANVVRELTEIEQVLRAALGGVDYHPLEAELAEVNGRLWEIEDGKRDCERRNCFDETFVALARSVYTENDRRAAIKRRINELVGSELVEEKSFRTASRERSEPSGLNDCGPTGVPGWIKSESVPDLLPVADRRATLPRVAVAGIPRSGTTMVFRALAGLPPGGMMPKDYAGPHIKTHTFEPQKLSGKADVAIFLFGDVVESVVSTRHNRYDARHFQDCGAGHLSPEITDIYDGDYLNYERMFDAWMQPNGIPHVCVRYEEVHSLAPLIACLIGHDFSLPPRVARKTLSTGTAPDRERIEGAYNGLIEKVRLAPALAYFRG